MEKIREIYWESLRAPSRNITMVKNPYRREKLMKKFFGKTAAQRKETRKFIKIREKEIIEERER